jgi:hypothetical protein
MAESKRPRIGLPNTLAQLGAVETIIRDDELNSPIVLFTNAPKNVNQKLEPLVDWKPYTVT